MFLVDSVQVGLFPTMRSATPHIGVERSVGPKTVVLSFPRVEVECLLALAERARGGADAVEGMNFLSPHIKGVDATIQRCNVATMQPEHG